MVNFLAGESNTTVSGGDLVLSNARFTVGMNSGTASTVDGVDVGGRLDVSSPYRIVIEYSFASGSEFLIYLDNNTTSQANSVHNFDSRAVRAGVGASHNPAEGLFNLNPAGGTLVFDSSRGYKSTGGFIQVRAESGAEIHISALRIEGAGLTEGGSSSSGGTTSSSSSASNSSAGAVIPASPTPSPLAIPNGQRTFYIATHGSNSNSGNQDQPFGTLNHAASRAQPGDVIVMRGGTYHHDDRITLTASGTASQPITVMAYPGETPIFNFEAQEEQPGRDGIRVNGSHWRLIGLHLTRAGGNGFRIHGSHNRIERCVAFENRLTGFHLEDGAYNLFLNNDSYRNFNMRGRVGNMADGFAAKYEALGPGNMFYGNRSWQNSDDGFDFWMATNRIYLINNWAFGNGDGDVFGNPSDFDGGGNGFKLGGNHIPGDHLVARNLAFDNFGVSGNAKGFDHNNNRGALTLVHNTAFNNGRNYTFPNAPQNGGNHFFYNNLSVNGGVQIPSSGIDQGGNSWQASFTPGTSMLQSVDTRLATGPRQSDGSLPNINLLRPRGDSPLVNGGVDIGESYSGSAPDMGAYEF